MAAYVKRIAVRDYIVVSITDNSYCSGDYDGITIVINKLLFSCCDILWGAARTLAHSFTQSVALLFEDDCSHQHPQVVACWDAALTLSPQFPHSGYPHLTLKDTT